MKVLIPSSYSIEETDVPASSIGYWSAFTAYDEGDQVRMGSVVDGGPLVNRLYTALRGENTSRAPHLHVEGETEATTSTDSITAGNGEHTLTVETGKSFLPGMLIKIAKTTTPVSLSMSAEVVSYNRVTGSLVAQVYSTTGSGTSTTWTITSASEVTFWRLDGVTNPYKMFEGSSNTQTVNDSQIEVKLSATNVGCVVLAQLVGLTVEVEVWNDAETEQLYSASHDIASSSALSTSIEDQFEHDYGSMRQRSSISVDLGGVYSSAIVVIRILMTSGEDAKCGLCVPGRTVTIGSTQYDLTIGLTNYSQPEEDDVTGVVSVTTAYSAKRNSIALRIDNTRIDHVYKLMQAMNGQVTAWLGNNSGTDYEALVVYGIFSDFDITIPGPNSSICTIEVVGIIEDGGGYFDPPTWPESEATTNAATWEQDDEIDLTVPFTM